MGAGGSGSVEEFPLKVCFLCEDRAPLMTGEEREHGCEQKEGWHTVWAGRTGIPEEGGQVA